MSQFVLFIIVLCILTEKSTCFVICPYCDPNYMAYPNLEEAMRGYDVPMGNPNPGRGNADPGIRNQIFSPMRRNEDGYYQLDMRFVTANHQIKCDATWASEVFDNFDSYVEGKMKASTTGLGIEFGPSIKAEVDKPDALSGKSRLGASMSIPPLFSRSWSNTNDIQNVENFYRKEHGSIVITEAICLTNQVDLGYHSKKVFVEPFIDAVKALYIAETEDLRFNEFKRFIDEFGTHYSSTSEMGTKLTIERRYSAKERASTDKNDLKNCNTVAGARIFGLQTEESHFHCNNSELIDNTLDSESVDRMIITTYGSFIAKSLAEWSQQVISLVQGSTFSPRAIRRELRSILHLFQDKNFEDVILETSGDKLNISKVIEWFEPMMSNYCEIFELDCNKTGCGFDDDCIPDQWCIAQDESPGYLCIHKNMTLKLESGRNFSGEVDSAKLPNGYGLEFYPSGQVLYEGQFKHGLKDGDGVFFYETGLKGYNGQFKENFMEGQGTIYSQDSGKKLYEGTLKRGNFLQGFFFHDNGTIADTIDLPPSK